MKRKKSQKQLRIEAEHNAFLKRMGVKARKKRESISPIPSYKTENMIPSRDINDMFPIGAVGSKRSIDDYKWKSGRQESSETIEAIEAKKKRIAPAFNKGPDQFITDGADISTLGKKV